MTQSSKTTSATKTAAKPRKPAQAKTPTNPGKEDTAATPPTDKPKSKLATLVELLSRPKGATLEAMTQATGWQAHSVRGAMSGSLKKAMGLTITSEKIEGVRIYRIAEGATA